MPRKVLMTIEVMLVLVSSFIKRLVFDNFPSLIFMLPSAISDEMFEDKMLYILPLN